MTDGFWERGLETARRRLAFLFSAELFATAGLFSFLSHMMQKAGWFMPDQRGGNVISIMICFLSMIAVYGAGELVRRKLKLKSIVLDNLVIDSRCKH